MKESEFIQLLNLYLDHEISAADAAKLEAEVQSNLGRRKVYEQYCRMQKACKILAADFQTETVGAEVASEKKVVAFDPVAATAASSRRTRNNWMVAAGGFAAAACVALVAMNRGSNVPPATSEQNTVAHTAPAPARETAVAVNQVAANRATSPVMLGNRAGQPVLVSDSLTLSGNNNVLTASANEANEQFKWMGTLELSPIDSRPANLRFDVQPASLRPEARTLGGDRTRPDQMSAFRFVK